MSWVGRTEPLRPVERVAIVRIPASSSGTFGAITWIKEPADGGPVARQTALTRIVMSEAAGRGAMAGESIALGLDRPVVHFDVDAELSVDGAVEWHFHHTSPWGDNAGHEISVLDAAHAAAIAGLAAALRHMEDQ